MHPHTFFCLLCLTARLTPSLRLRDTWLFLDGDSERQLDRQQRCIG
jgi:hypothetical protein